MPKDLHSERGWCAVMPAKGKARPLVLTTTFSINLVFCRRKLVFWADQACSEGIKQFGLDGAEWWDGYMEAGTQKAKERWLEARGFRCDMAYVMVTPAVPARKT